MESPRSEGFWRELRSHSVSRLINASLLPDLGRRLLLSFSFRVSRDKDSIYQLQSAVYYVSCVALSVFVLEKDAFGNTDFCRLKCQTTTEEMGKHINSKPFPNLW